MVPLAALLLAASLSARAQEPVGSPDLGEGVRAMAGQAKEALAAKTERSAVLDVEAVAPAPPEKPEHGVSNPCALKPAQDRDCAGRTLAHPTASVDREWERDDARRVMWVKSLKVGFGVKQTLYVSSDYAEDSCPYRVTFEHEKRHWADNDALSEKAVQGLRRDLLALAWPTKSAPVAVSEHADDDLDALLAPVLRQWAHDLKHAAAAAAAARDEPQAYRRNDWSRCSPEQWRSDLP